MTDNRTPTAFDIDTAERFRREVLEAQRRWSMIEEVFNVRQPLVQHVGKDGKGLWF